MSIARLYKIFRNSSGITIDSRKAGKGTIFFALSGTCDGNQFAADALKQGCAWAVIDNKRYKTDKRCILVDHSLEALQQLAHHHRKNLKSPIIAITGSNGKTTTKELIAHVLRKKYHTFCTAGNLNNHIGVPLSLLSIHKDHEIAIIEMGANHSGEIAGHCLIAEPAYGIITNISDAHIGEFNGKAGIIRAKGELYHYIRKNKGTVFINSSDRLLMGMSRGIKRITYGKAGSALCRGTPLNGFPFLSVRYGKSKLVTCLMGGVNFENVMAALCVGSTFGIEEQEMLDAIEKFVPANNRSQLVEKNSNLLILDAYNANPASMTAMLKAFGRWKKNEFPLPSYYNHLKPKFLCATGRAVILGEMLELGRFSLAKHTTILRLCVQSTFNRIFIVGNEFMRAMQKSGITEPRITAFASTEEAMGYFSTKKLNNSIVLLKGSRGNKLEKIADVL